MKSIHLSQIRDLYANSYQALILTCLLTKFELPKEGDNFITPILRVNNLLFKNNFSKKKPTSKKLNSTN